MDIDFNMFEKQLNKDLLNDQFIMEEIFNYWDCNNNDLANESMIAVLNYIYELGKKHKQRMTLNREDLE